MRRVVQEGGVIGYECSGKGAVCLVLEILADGG